MNEHVERAGIGDCFCFLVLLTFWEMEASGMAGFLPPTPILGSLLAPKACTEHRVRDTSCAQSLISALAKPMGSCDVYLLVIHKCILYFHLGS